MTEKEFSTVVAQFVDQIDLQQADLENFINSLLKQCKVMLKGLTTERLVKIVSTAVSCLTISKDVAAGDYQFTVQELKIIHTIIKGGDRCASVH